MSKRALFAGIGFLCWAPLGWAATVSVPGDTATINGALEMLDYNDGEDDLVLVGPGVYDEQIFPKGNAGVDSSEFPSVENLSIQAIEDCIASHADRLEIRGSDPNFPPVIRIESASPESYGFFPGELGRYFYSTVVMGAKDVLFTNIEVRSNPDEYTINGSASNWVWQDCVFSNGSGSVGAGSDFCDYQNNRELNSDNNPDIGLDNEYVYSNCIIDGEDLLDGSGARFDNAFVWWHGYGGDTPPGEAVGSGVLLENCVIRNWGNDILFNFNSNGMGGTRGGLGPVTVQDCFFSASQDLFSFRGACEDVVFIRNVINGEQAPGNEGGFAIRIRERNSSLGARGFTEDLVIANNLFVGTEDFTQVYLGLQESVTTDEPNLFVVNNTFYDYEVSQGVVFVTGPSGGNLSVANNIFMATETGAVGHAVNVGNPTVNAIVENNLFWNNVTNLTDTSQTISSGNQYGNPGFISTSVIIPDRPPVPVLQQGFVPSSIFAIDAGSMQAYQVIGDVIGLLDVDSDNTRPTSGQIDIGAQEVNSNDPYCALYPCSPTPNPFDPTLTATPTPTGTPIPTEIPAPTETPTQIPSASLTATLTPDPGDINLDGAIDAKDLMMLLSDWKKINGS